MLRRLEECLYTPLVFPYILTGISEVRMLSEYKWPKDEMALSYHFAIKVSTYYKRDFVIGAHLFKTMVRLNSKVL